MFSLRKADYADIPQLRELFRETILTVNRYNYTKEEVEDWASCGESDERWIELIDDLYFIVAENEDGMIVGFSSISDKGYLHSMFVHKDFQNRGIATQLYNEVESYVIQHKVRIIRSEVSITAHPFFISRGFVDEEIQSRKAKYLYLVNYKMKKKL